MYLALSLSQLEGKMIIKKNMGRRTWIGKLHPLKKTKQYQFKEHQITFKTKKNKKNKEEEEEEKEEEEEEEEEEGTTNLALLIRNHKKKKKKMTTFVVFVFLLIY